MERWGTGGGWKEMPGGPGDGSSWGKEVKIWVADSGAPKQAHHLCPSAAHTPPECPGWEGHLTSRLESMVIFSALVSWILHAVLKAYF